MKFDFEDEDEGDTKKKLSEALKGRTVSVETRRKLSEARQRYLERMRND